MGNPCLDVVEAELNAADVPYQVSRTHKHVHINFGNDYEHLHVVAATPSDYRAHKNERALIRRELKRLGYVDFEPEPNIASPLVSVSNGSAVCLSPSVAEQFGKKHKNVLQAIDKVREECGQEFDRLNFQPIDYRDAKGRSYRAYEMTRDGFSLVVMGFTGEAATKWKVRYIEAFNALEGELGRYASQTQVDALRGDLDAMLDLVTAIPAPVKQHTNSDWLLRSLARRGRSKRYQRALGVST